MQAKKRFIKSFLFCLDFIQEIYTVWGQIIIIQQRFKDKIVTS